MSDLDQVLDAFVADVRSETRAPGASIAIERAHRRRKVSAAAGAVVAVAVVAVGGGLAAETLGGSDQVSPIGEPTTPSPTTAQASAEPRPNSYAFFEAGLEAIVVQVPGWVITEYYDVPPDYDDAVHGPCSGNFWGGPGSSASSGGIGPAGVGLAGFRSQAQASDHVAGFVESLESCTATAWQTQPIAQTGTVLAYSPDAVAWIQQNRTDVRVLQIPTSDGPPPLSVQVEVAEWMVPYSTWMEQR